MFHKDSYGYRPGKSAIDAVGQTRQRCWKFNYVIKFDIKGLFDNIDHELLKKAVRKHAKEPWKLKAMNLHRLSGSKFEMIAEAINPMVRRWLNYFKKLLSFSNELHRGLPEQKAGPKGNAEIQTIQGESKTGRRMVERHRKKRTQNVCTLGSRMVAIRE